MTLTRNARWRLARRLLSIGALTSLTAAVAVAGDWPQWRGPHRDGIARETQWSVTGQSEDLWSKSVGLGYSTVSIADGRLYTQGHDKDAGHDTLWCLDAATGGEIWKRTWPAKVWDQFHGGGTLATPSIDGDRLYVATREGRFYCFAAETGEEIWFQHLQEEHDLKHPQWGFGASPLVLDDMVVLNLGVVFAFDKKTGKELWRTPKNYGAAYSTPADFERGGNSGLAVFNQTGLVLLDRTDGKELLVQPWKTKYEVNASTPVVLGDRVFISSGYNHGCAMVKVSGDAPEVLWESKVMRTQMAGAVLWEDHLYGFDEAELKCIDLDGNEKWRQRDLGKGAHLVADGKLIIVSAEGELVIAEADPGKYQELSRTKILDGGVCWTTPVLVDGLIYCRNSLGQLVCRDHRPQASGG